MRTGWILTAAWLVSLTSVPASAAPVDDLRGALEEMHDWVGESSNGQRWRRFLRSSDLEEQLEHGEAVDVELLSSVLNRYASNTPGLDKRRFVAVREALAAWVEELTSTPTADLSAILAEAKESFRPITAESVAAAKEKLNEEANALNEFLNSGSSGNADAWREYLDWEEMQAELGKEAIDIQALNSVLRQYYTNEPGLEMSHFTAVRRALRRYMNYAYFAADDKIQEKYQAQLEKLTELLATYADVPSTDGGLEIGRILGWLDRVEQVPTLTNAVRSQLSSPNLRIRLSEQLVGAGVARSVDRVNSVRESILGTAVRGRAQATGTVALDLVPNDTRAAFNIKFVGEVRSRTTGYNGPVTIYSTGFSNVWVEKLVHADQFGLAGNRAKGRATASTNINSIAAPLPIIRRIAWNRARGSKRQAERIAAGRTAGRMSRQMDTQAAEFLDRANQQFVEEFRKPLLRRDSFPRQMAMSSGESELKVTMLHANRFQLGAPGDAPELSSEHDMAVRVHDSIIGNFSESLLGGRTITNEQLAEMLADMNIDVPAEVSGGVDEPPWSITFAQQQPISARFADGNATFTIRTRRVVRGDNDVRKPIAISATYKLEQAGGGAKMTREGDISVEYSGRAGLTPGEVAMKTIMQKKFQALFEPEIVSDGLTLPGEWEKAGKLMLRELWSNDGWLALGWEQPPADVRTANAETEEDLN